MDETSHKQDATLHEIPTQDCEAKGQVKEAYVCGSFCFKAFISGCKSTSWCVRGICLRGGSVRATMCQLVYISAWSIWVQTSFVGLRKLHVRNEEKPGERFQDNEPCWKNEITQPQSSFGFLEELRLCKSSWRAI